MASPALEQLAGALRGGDLRPRPGDLAAAFQGPAVAAARAAYEQVRHAGYDGVARHLRPERLWACIAARRAHG